MIKFGISRNYVPDWTVVSAIREIYQNFIDYGDFEVEIDELKDGYSTVCLTNNFNPESWEFLKIGFTKKESGSIAGHGEGLKLAGLIFLRNNLHFDIYSTIGHANPVFYNDSNIGECYGLDVDVDEKQLAQFVVEFSCKNEDIAVFKEGYIKESDVLHKSYYGNIVNKPKGNIYIGGLYVCNVDRLKYSFDFKPEHVSLGRDRDFPSTWDVEYYANRIVNHCSDKLNIKVSDLNNREFSYGDIPNKISERFTPSYDNGKLIMKSGNTVISDMSMVNKILENPKVRARVERIKVNELKQSDLTPYQIMRQLRNDLELGSNKNIIFDSVLKLSKLWK